MTDNREFIEEFLVESTENLDQLDRDLIALEERPDDAQRVASIFRAVHTIKGNSGFFGFSKLGALAHSGEHLLGKLRDGTIVLDDRISGSLYSMVDAVRAILRSIEETGGEGDHDYRELSRSLAAVAAEESPSKPRSAVAPPTVALVAPKVDEPPTSALTGSAPPTETPSFPTATESTIRVDVGLVASILDLVGELVLARNQLRSIDSEDPAVQAVFHRVSAATTALQEAAVKTRMQPIEHVFSKFPRTVRDLAVACGKEVQLVVDGADTELDRTVVESIRDPLTHLIRNAIDHGIEPPDTRIEKGKPRSGRLSLRAFNESGQVTIEVSDDGAGIAVDAVREKALARGLIDGAAAATLPDERILQFIFEPGFSTAKQVTSVSGRGVGMDVVKTNIEAIGGTVDIQSGAGAGTTVRVRVPLTLAIIPALIFRCGGDRFAIPQAAVIELVPLRSDRAGPRLEGFADSPVMRVRGRLVPVVFLDRFLGLRSETACREQGTVVLVRVDDREFGLVVDGMQAGGAGGRDLLEAASLTTVVVKPIGGLLAQLGIYSGGTVLGDGEVVLVLDLRGVVRAAALPPIEREAAAPAEISRDDACRGDRYLVCMTRAGRRVAVPLAHVVRLEQYPASQLEPLGSRLVVRRGDAFTPVVDADALLGGGQSISGERVQLVVIDGRQGNAGRLGGLGLAVGGIIDVAAADSDLQPDLAARGIAGSLALGGLATEVLDVAAAATLLHLQTP